MRRKIKMSKLGHRNGKITCIGCVEPNLGAINEGGLWRCRCDCGNERYVRGYSLRTGKRGPKSCGCSTKEEIAQGSIRRRKYDQATINYYYLVHKVSAKSLDETPLTKEEWYKIVLLPCFYCGTVETRNIGRRKGRIKGTHVKYTPEELDRYDVKMNGVDRVDSSLGYFVENCVPCCEMCNLMKKDYTQDEFLEKVKLIHNKHNL